MSHYVIIILLQLYLVTRPSPLGLGTVIIIYILYYKLICLTKTFKSWSLIHIKSSEVSLVNFNSISNVNLSPFK